MNEQIDNQHPKGLSPRLAALTGAVAAATPAPAAVEHAQARLMGRLQAMPARTQRLSRARWVAATSAAALALVALLAVPLLSDRGEAFAAVQGHFRDFSTLSMRIEQRIEGRTLQTSRMVVDRNGVLRTDVGEQLSIIVDPVRGRMLTLLHGPRRAMLMPLARAGASPAAALDWLNGIRQFQGEAERLPGSRRIDGRDARGWELEVEGQRMVLWADSDGLPLEMETGGAGGLELHYRFRFDAAVPPGHLVSEVPAGYRMAEPDRH